MQCGVPFLLYNTNRMWTSYSVLGNSNRKPYSSQRQFLHRHRRRRRPRRRHHHHHHHHRCHMYLQSQILKPPYLTRILNDHIHIHPHKTKLHFTLGHHVYIKWGRQHFEVLTAVLLDIQAFSDMITLRLMRGSWHFEGLLCLHLQVSNMDLSSTCKLSSFLDCLTLQDKWHNPAKHWDHSPNDMDDLNPQHKICMNGNL